jgi:lipooligosaccharide transport system permease protein
MLATLPLFGLIPSIWSLALLPVLFAEGIIFAAFGLIMTAVAKNYDFFNYFTSLVITPLFLFSGIFFSLKSVSSPLRESLMFLPLANVVSLSRTFCYGHIQGNLLLELINIAAFALLSSWTATILLKKRLIQ